MIESFKRGFLYAIKHHEKYAHLIFLWMQAIIDASCNDSSKLVRFGRIEDCQDFIAPLAPVALHSLLKRVLPVAADRILLMSSGVPAPIIVFLSIGYHINKVREASTLSEYSKEVKCLAESVSYLIAGFSGNARSSIHAADRLNDSLEYDDLFPFKANFFDRFELTVPSGPQSVTLNDKITELTNILGQLNHTERNTTEHNTSSIRFDSLLQIQNITWPEQTKNAILNFDNSEDCRAGTLIINKDRLSCTGSFIKLTNLKMMDSVMIYGRSGISHFLFPLPENTAFLSLGRPYWRQHEVQLDDIYNMKTLLVHLKVDGTKISALPFFLIQYWAYEEKPLLILVARDKKNIPFIELNYEGFLNDCDVFFRSVVNGMVIFRVHCEGDRVQVILKLSPKLAKVLFFIKYMYSDRKLNAMINFMTDGSLPFLQIDAGRVAKKHLSKIAQSLPRLFRRKFSSIAINNALHDRYDLPLNTSAAMSHINGQDIFNIPDILPINSVFGSHYPAAVLPHQAINILAGDEAIDLRYTSSFDKGNVEVPDDTKMISLRLWDVLEVFLDASGKDLCLKSSYKKLNFYFPLKDMVICLKNYFSLDESSNYGLKINGIFYDVRRNPQGQISLSAQFKPALIETSIQKEDLMSACSSARFIEANPEKTGVWENYMYIGLYAIKVDRFHKNFPINFDASGNDDSVYSLGELQKLSDIYTVNYKIRAPFYLNRNAYSRINGNDTLSNSDHTLAISHHDHNTENMRSRRSIRYEFQKNSASHTVSWWTDMVSLAYGCVNQIKSLLNANPSLATPSVYHNSLDRVEGRKSWLFFQVGYQKLSNWWALQQAPSDGENVQHSVQAEHRFTPKVDRSDPRSTAEMPTFAQDRAMSECISVVACAVSDGFPHTKTGRSLKKADEKALYPYPSIYTDQASYKDARQSRRLRIYAGKPHDRQQELLCKALCLSREVVVCNGRPIDRYAFFKEGFDMLSNSNLSLQQKLAKEGQLLENKSIHT